MTRDEAAAALGVEASDVEHVIAHGTDPTEPDLPSADIPLGILVPLGPRRIQIPTWRVKSSHPAIGAEIIERAGETDSELARRLSVAGDRMRVQAARGPGSR